MSIYFSACRLHTPSYNRPNTHPPSPQYLLSSWIFLPDRGEVADHHVIALIVEQGLDQIPLSIYSEHFPFLRVERGSSRSPPSHRHFRASVAPPLTLCTFTPLSCCARRHKPRPSKLITTAMGVTNLTFGIPLVTVVWYLRAAWLLV